jgi:hypothetical protein
MNLKNTLKITALLLFANSAIFAQDFSVRSGKVFGREIKSVNPKNNTVRCVSSEYEEYLQEIDPERMNEAEFEAWLAPLVEETKKKMLSNANRRSTNEIITIPVVVHVVSNRSTNTPSNSTSGNGNITDARVISQINALNDDFRRRGAGSNQHEFGADIEIEFCLAKVDPQGNLTNGINRVAAPTSSLSESYIQNTLKPDTQWNPSQYFNIWVVNFLDGDLLGYAQFPTASSLQGLSGISPTTANTDGVVINWKAFGSRQHMPTGTTIGTISSQFDGGRTTTHEVGHALGLRHIWGDTSNCTVNATDSNNDYCLDTPPARNANQGCPTGIDSCPSDNYIDMIENFMDYSDDACLNTFTLDQKARILTVLNNSPRRRSLKTSTVCQENNMSNSSFELIQGLNLYPNPATDMVTLTISDNVLVPDNYTIFNSLGQTIASKQISNTQDLSINVSNLSVGVYFIKVTKDNNSKTLKFIKE